MRLHDAFSNFEICDNILNIKISFEILILLQRFWIIDAVIRCNQPHQVNYFNECILWITTLAISYQIKQHWFFYKRATSGKNIKTIEKHDKVKKSIFVKDCRSNVQAMDLCMYMFVKYVLVLEKSNISVKGNVKTLLILSTRCDG